MSAKELKKDIKKGVSDRKQSEVTRQQIEDALRQSERKYRTITENITVGIFRSTAGPKGRFIEVNSALVKMLGYKNKDTFLGAIRRVYGIKVSELPREYPVINQEPPENIILRV